MNRNRFTLSGVMMFIAAVVFFVGLACPKANAEPRRRAVTPEPDTAKYLQYACWTHDAHAERLARVSAYIAEHRTESGVVTPPMVTTDENMRRHAAIFDYMRRETFCNPPEVIAAYFTRSEAREMYVSVSFLVDVSFYLDALHGSGGW